MSGLAEFVCNFSPDLNDFKIASFCESISQNSLEVWTFNTANYGQTYLFAVWFYQKYASSNNVRSLLNNGKVGRYAIQEFAHETFEDTISKWLCALYINAYTDVNSPFGTYQIDLLRYAQNGIAKHVSQYPATLQFSVKPSTAEYIEFSSGQGKKLNITLPAGIRCYEVHR